MTRRRGKFTQIGEKALSAGNQIDGSVFALCLCISFLCSFPITYQAHLPELADSRGCVEAAGATMLSVTGEMNTLSKLVFGTLVLTCGLVLKAYKKAGV